MNNMKSLESAGTNPSLEKCINPDLWYACAGPLVSLPPVGSLVVYFPQGHIEQVAASMRKDNSVQIPSYPNLPSKLICILQNVTLHAYAETDEVYAQMTLQPVNTYGKEVLLASDVAPKTTRQQTEFFCKTLTASDTSTHGGFSVPRRAAEKIFPPLDFSKQPPAQELKARDLHDNEWIFRHIYRGQPKRHLLTTGWSLFVSAKRLLAGDSVLFIRDDKSQLLLGIRRANRQLANASSSVLSSDSMHFGILAAAAHASANNSSFTVFFNPRASPSEFIIPLSKYNKAMFNSQISPGMRFRMMFETEDSGTRRYMGTITGVTDLDPIRWKNSLWKNLQVAWDESSAGERRDRVSIWDIEPVETPFFIFPPPFFRAKRPRLPEIPDDEATDSDNVFRKTFPWFMEDTFLKDPQAPNPIPALSLTQWMALQQNPSLNSPILPDSLPSMSSSTIQNLCQIDLSHQLGLQGKMLQQNNLQFNSSKQPIQSHTNHLSNLPISNNLLGTVMQSQPINELNQQPKKNLAGQTPLQSQTQIPILHQQISGETTLPQQPLLPNLHSQSNFSTQQQTHHQSQLQVQNIHMNSQMQVSEQQMQLQILQKIQQHPLLSPCNFSNSGNSTQSKLAHEGTVFSNPPANQPQQNQETILAEIIGSGLPYPPPSNLLSTPGVNLLPTGATQSGLAVNGESCYTSSSMSQCPVPSQPFACKPTCNGNLEEELVQSSDMILNKDLLKVDVKPLIRVVKTSGEGTSLQPYACAAQIDCLDSSSSVTSACLSQPDDNEDNVYQIDPFGQNYPQSFNKFSTPFREDNEVQANPRSGCVSDVNIDGQFDMPLLPDRLEKNIFSGKDFYQNPSSGNLFIKYSTNTKDDHQELSSSIVSQSHGVQDMEFNSTNSMANDGSFINRSLMTHPPFQPPRMRTFTKVYKRGAVGRSIDITRYSGYDELKQDLARRFSIEGQLEDQQRIGWKLVYVDHENDILLVGDDPWDEFVSCVRYIKILSPQEVQQMSFDEDLGNCIPNQACSSSDGGNACWGSCVGDVNPSIRSQAH